LFRNRADERESYGKATWRCAACSLLFNTFYDLKQHIKTLHLKLEKPYGCTECDKSYSTTTCLREHMRNHTGEKPFQCSVCFQTFASKGRAVRHERLHDGKKFACPQCFMTFTRPDAVKKHMRFRCKGTINRIAIGPATL
jgi:KRAB domain-containing zinc finger protein